MRSTQREDMKLRKRIAGICVGVIGIFILVLFFSFSVRTAEKQTYHWEAEEVIEHVDPNGKSEEGFWYAVNDERDAVYIYDYSPTDENSILIEEENEIRIPDKVIFEGEETEYPVTSISINPQGTENLRALPLLTVYIGKDIASIDLDYLFWPMTFEVHPENPHFISENGSLYSKDKKILYRFGDMGYEEGDCFTIPDTVETVRGSAFLQTELQEVVLNEQITEIPNNCFYRSNIQRIHTKEVTTIGERAFSHSEQIKDVYLPKVKQMGNYAFAGCRRLDRVLCGTKESCRFDALSIFENCYRLRTLILPENVSALGEHALAGCISLRILYLPEPLAELGNDSLGVCGELAVYVEGEIPDYYDSNVTFYQAPAHNGQKVTYISSPFWAVEGNYCADCGQGGAFTTEVGDVAPPELSEPADQCPSVLPVNRNLTDTNGVVYQIESRTKTAEVKGIDTSRPFKKNYFAIPEKIEVEGEEYIVDRIGPSSLNVYRGYVILPDTITTIETGAFCGGSLDRLVLGKNVKEIAPYALPRYVGNDIATVVVPEDNPNFSVKDGVLYDKTQSVLYYCSEDAGNEEFTVPKTVHSIRPYAFTKSRLNRIVLPNKSKMTIAEDAFRDCDAEILDQADESVDFPEEISLTDWTWYSSEDRVVELDESYSDEEGNRYKLDGVNRTATCVYLNPGDGTEDVVVRVPDQVIFDSRTYGVTEISLSSYDYPNISDPSEGLDTFHIFVGRRVTGIDLYSFRERVAVHMHRDNYGFASRGGSLFSLAVDGEKLERFYDGVYDKDTVYVVPANVNVIQPCAFLGSKIGGVVLNDKIEELNLFCFAHTTISTIDLNRVTRIATNALEGTKNLKEITLPANTEYLETSFWGSGLEVVRQQGVESVVVTSENRSVRSKWGCDYLQSAPVTWFTGDEHGVVTPVPSVAPTATSTATPAITPTPTVTPTATSVPTIIPTVTPGTTPPSKTATPVTVAPGQNKESLDFSGIKVLPEEGEQVRITWEIIGKASAIKIYRSGKKTGGFKERKQMGGNSVSYVDRSVKEGKKYYYKIRACSAMGVQKWSTVYAVQMQEFVTPSIQVKKGRAGKIHYIEIRLKKYSGKYVDIFFDTGKGYKKVKLFSHQIRKYKGKFKIKYTLQNTSLRIRVRTYKKKGKKKIYSTWSKARKIQV